MTLTPRQQAMITHALHVGLSWLRGMTNDLARQDAKLLREAIDLLNDDLPDEPTDLEPGAAPVDPTLTVEVPPS